MLSLGFSRFLLLPQKGKQCKKKHTHTDLSVYQRNGWVQIFVYYQSCWFFLILCVSVKRTPYYSPFVEYKKTFSLHVESLKILVSCCCLVFREYRTHTNHKIHMMRVLKKLQRYFTEHTFVYVSNHPEWSLFCFTYTYSSRFFRRNPFPSAIVCVSIVCMASFITKGEFKSSACGLHSHGESHSQFWCVCMFSKNWTNLWYMRENVWVCWENRTQTSVADTF